MKQRIEESWRDEAIRIDEEQNIRGSRSRSLVRGNGEARVGRQTNESHLRLTLLDGRSAGIGRVIVNDHNFPVETGQRGRKRGETLRQMRAAVVVDDDGGDVGRYARGIIIACASPRSSSIGMPAPT